MQAFPACLALVLRYIRSGPLANPAIGLGRYETSYRLRQESCQEHKGVTRF